MHAIPSEPEAFSAGTTTQPLDLAADMRRAWALANWMDAQFEVAGIKFGYDAIIGLVPGIGDTISMLAALYPVYVARKHKLGRVVMGRMLVNVGVDWLAGAVPLLGDVLDVGFKANLKNVQLLEQAAKRRTSR
jgi:hypothetical protein